jgi:type I restriction enzyme, S subunit
MGKWINIKLVELAKHIQSGGTPKSDNPEYYGGDIPFVSIEDMTASGKYLSKTIKTISNEGLKNSTAWLVPSEAIMYSIYATLGLPVISKITAATNQAILNIISNEEKIVTEFLYYYLLSLRNEIHKFSSQTTQSNLNAKIVKNFDLYIPEDKPEQTRIAQILSKADTAIAQTEALIAKYQRIKTGLMQDLLTRGIDEHGNIRSKATHRFVVKNGIEVPEEWEVLEIGEITEHVGSGVTPKGGSNVYSHEGILLIRSQNVLVGEFSLEDVAFITPEINDRMQRSELQDLDVLLNITGASIGRSHFIPINFPKSNVNQHVCALRIKNRSLGKSLFLSSFLNSYEGQKQIKRLLGASNREGLNYQLIREIKLPMPKLEDDTEYQKIYSVLSSINNKLDTLKANWTKQTSLKTGLMQDLLSGRVRVK